MKPEPGEPAAPKPLPNPPSANGNQPPSIEDLNRQIKELNMKNKEGEKPPASEPADKPPKE